MGVNESLAFAVTKRPACAIFELLRQFQEGEGNALSIPIG